MSRDDGFTRADIDTSLLDDAKFRAFWRLVGTPEAFDNGLRLYVATVLASWQAGRRRSLDDANPPHLPIHEPIVKALQQVGLLDKRRRIPETVWQSWFTPAFERRRKARESGRLGGLAAHQNDAIRAERPSTVPWSSARPGLDRSLDPSLPSVPSSPSERSSRVSEVADGLRVVDAPSAGRGNGFARPGIVPTEGPCRKCREHVTDHLAGVKVGVGFMQHATCAPAATDRIDAEAHEG